jgi:release factor glutamine methyltransferase
VRAASQSGRDSRQNESSPIHALSQPKPAKSGRKRTNIWFLRFPLSALPQRLSAYIVRVTVLETIQRSTEFLTRKGVESPRLNAELLLARVLNLPRMRLYLQFERALTTEETDHMRTWVTRRGQREPVQHILGVANFCGFELRVNTQVLVPRPETELLAEAAWKHLNQLPGEPLVFDYGTGSGCLAVALACKAPHCRVIAVDISPQALEIARQNAATHHVSERITFVISDRLDALTSGSPAAIIVGNPPYIPAGQISTLDPEVRQFDPRLALDGGPDGLNHYRYLAEHAAPWLPPSGKMMLEFGDGQQDAIRVLLEKQNWIVEAIINDYTPLPRIIVVRRPDTILPSSPPGTACSNAMESVGLPGQGT